MRLPSPGNASAAAPHLAVNLPGVAGTGADSSTGAADSFRPVGDVLGSQQGVGGGSSSDMDGGFESPAAGGKAAGAAAGAAAVKGASIDADTNRSQGREDQGDVGSFKEVPFRDADSSSVLPVTGKGVSSKGKGGKPLLQCSRTKWAVCLIVGIVLVLAAVGGGVAAFMLRRHKASAGAGGAAPPASTQPTQPTASKAAPGEF